MKLLIVGDAAGRASAVARGDRRLRMIPFLRVTMRPIEKVAKPISIGRPRD